jgi:hypothetical protein
VLLQDERLFCKLLTRKSIAPVAQSAEQRRDFAPVACAPVAQLDRASDFGSEGWGFDSLRVHDNEVGCSRTIKNLLASNLYYPAHSIHGVFQMKPIRKICEKGEINFIKNPAVFSGFFISSCLF